MPDGPEQEARDEIFLSRLGKRERDGDEEVRRPFPSRWTCPVVQGWIWGYDAYQEVREALSRDPFL